LHVHAREFNVGKGNLTKLRFLDKGGDRAVERMIFFCCKWWQVLQVEFLKRTLVVPIDGVSKKFARS